MDAGERELSSHRLNVVLGVPPASIQSGMPIWVCYDILWQITDSLCLSPLYSEIVSIAFPDVHRWEVL